MIDSLSPASSGLVAGSQQILIILVCPPPRRTWTGTASDREKPCFSSAEQRFMPHCKKTRSKNQIPLSNHQGIATNNSTAAKYAERQLRSGRETVPASRSGLREAVPVSNEFKSIAKRICGLEPLPIRQRAVPPHRIALLNLFGHPAPSEPSTGTAHHRSLRTAL